MPIACTLEPTLSGITTSLAALPSNISDAIWPQLLPAPGAPGSPATSGFATPQTTEPLQIEDISIADPSLEVPQSSILFGDIAG